MKHRAMPVDLSAIRRVKLLTVEGENDDISGIGQTLAAQDLCQSLPHSMKANYLQEKVGHYGVFNGSRFRKKIVPRIREFHSWISRPVHSLKLVATAETKCAKGRRNNAPAGLRVRLKAIALISSSCEPSCERWDMGNENPRCAFDFHLEGPGGTPHSSRVNATSC